MYNRRVAVVTFHRVAGMGRFRQIIVPMRAHFRPIENVTDAGKAAESAERGVWERNEDIE